MVHLSVHYVCYIMLVRRFEQKGRRFLQISIIIIIINFCSLRHCDVYNPDPEPRLLKKGTRKDSSHFSVALRPTVHTDY